MLRLAFDFIITWRETRTRPNAYLHGECFAIIFGYHSQASGTAVHTVQLFIERKFAHNRFFCFTLRVSRFVSLPQVTHSGIVQSIRISLLGLSVR